MSPDQLDSVYTALCRAVGGQADEAELLTRLVLLLALDVADPDLIRQRIDEARTS